jgi:molybdopterin-guanine dinucleotide biosynthesis protein A
LRKELSGAILVGGRSRRMGTDKALMLLEGETLLQRTIAVLSLVCCEILVVGNRSDLQVSGARLVADDWQDAGIMGGIATA